MNRLGEQFEVVASLAGAGENLDGSGLAAEEHDAGVGAGFADRDRGFYAVDMGHHHVGKHQFRAVLLREVDRVGAGVGGFGDEAVAIQDLDDCVRNKSFIVNNQDAWRRGVVVDPIPVLRDGVRLYVLASLKSR